MSKAAVGAYVHKPFDIHGDLTSEVAFNSIVPLNGSPQLRKLLFSEILNADIRVDPRVL